MNDFYVFEGINGSGKTTVLQAVAQRLRNRSGDGRVVTLCNPTPGPIGQEIRRFVAEQRDRGFPPFFSYEAMRFAQRLAVLFAADRHQQQDEIAAALADGKIVLCDRYSLSTLVYQCAMVGEIHYEGEMAKLIAGMHTEVIAPRATLIIDVPVDVARARLAARGERNDDRMMASIEPAARAMYLDIESSMDPPIEMGEVFPINGCQSIEDVVEDIMSSL